MLVDDQKRAEFLRKNSPLKNSKNTNNHSVVAPPLFVEDTIKQNEAVEDSRGDSLGNNITDKKTIFAEVNQEHRKGFDFKFWRNWDTNHYAYASIGLAAMLLLYVGLSFYNNLSGFNSNELNATLNVNQSNNSSEQTLQVDGVLNDNIIVEDVVDSNLIMDEIQNSPLQGRELNITEYFLENYGL